MHDPKTARPEIDPVTGTPLSSHEWDGLRELETAPPRWWLLTYVACVVFSIGYWVAYPAWPWLAGHTRGLLGWSSRGAVEQTMAQAEAKQGGMRERIRAASLDEIRTQPELLQFAIAGGRAAFGNHCAQCHGTGAQGQLGFPNLLDDDWLWGGALEQIAQTIRFGIRSTHPDSRLSAMPAFGNDGVLERKQIDDVAEFVLSLRNRIVATAAAERGSKLFEENCVACHGAKGEGNREVGAPRLDDAISLYGSDKQSIVQTITGSRRGVMPHWQGRLPDETIKQLTVYLHALGGGE